MNKVFRICAASTIITAFFINPAHAEKWLSQGIICHNYEDTISMALESNLASSDLEAMKVLMNYITNGKCITHKKCERVYYQGRGSTKYFEELKKQGKEGLIKTAKSFPISGIKLTKNGKIYYVQDDYLVPSEDKCS